MLERRVMEQRITLVGPNLARGGMSVAVLERGALSRLRRGEGLRTCQGPAFQWTGREAWLLPDDAGTVLIGGMRLWCSTTFWNALPTRNRRGSV